MVRRLQQKNWLIVGWNPWSGRQNERRVRPVRGYKGRRLGAWLRLWLRRRTNTNPHPTPKAHPRNYTDTPAEEQENAVVQVHISGVRISCVYPRIFHVAGSSTLWKATSPNPADSTVWLACVRERRGYLWGGLRSGGSNLGGGTGGVLGRRHGGTVGGTLGGSWGSALLFSGGICIIARVCLGGGVGVGVGAPVAAKKLANCWMESMVWAPK